MTTTDSGTPHRNLHEVRKQAEALFMNRQFEPSRQLYGQLAADPRSATEGRYGLGMIALQADGNLVVAQSHFDACLHRSPRHDRAMVGRGLVEERRNDVARARQWYVEAAALGNQNAAKAVSRLDQAAARARATPPGTGPAASAAGTAHSYTPVSQLAKQPSGKGVHGKVSALEQRHEPRGARKAPRLVVLFRVEREGQSPVPVELRGEVLQGSIKPGDQVEIPPKLARGRPVNSAVSSAEFWNLTTGAKVKVAYSDATTNGWAILTAIPVAAFVVWVLYRIGVLG